MESFVVSWSSLLDYFKETREGIISEIAEAPTDRDLQKAQGKLELLQEFLNLKAVFETMAQEKVEAALEAAKPQLTVREKVDKALGVEEAIKMYGKVKGG